MIKKKGQLSLGDAPTVVLVVGLTFLVMATVALIGEKYGNSFPSSEAVSVNNETLVTVTETGEYVAHSSDCNFEDFTVVRVTFKENVTIISSGNYTVGTDGKISFKTGGGAVYNNTDWNVTYTSSFAGAACNVTKDLNTNISDNTSIAGIVLTISLVGIVLSILIGVFLGIRKSSSRV